MAHPRFRVRWYRGQPWLGSKVALRLRIEPADAGSKPPGTMDPVPPPAELLPAGSEAPGVPEQAPQPPLKSQQQPEPQQPEPQQLTEPQQPEPPGQKPQQPTPEPQSPPANPPRLQPPQPPGSPADTSPTLQQASHPTPPRSLFEPRSENPGEGSAPRLGPIARDVEEPRPTAAAQDTGHAAGPIQASPLQPSVGDDAAATVAPAEPTEDRPGTGDAAGMPTQRQPDDGPTEDTPTDSEELAEPRADQPGWRLSYLALGLTFALGLGFGLLAWAFSDALREDLPSRPEVRRMALENRALQQDLDRQRVELEGKLHKAEIEDARLRREWEAIVEELEALGEEQVQAATRAQALSDRLDIFVRRNQSLAQRADLPEAVRRQADGLSEEGEFYRAALRREMDRLEEEKQRFLSWIQRLDEEAKSRLVRGISVRVIHDERRKEDAERVAGLLNGAGADAHLFATDIANPEAHKGRVYYHGRSEEAAARQIAHMVEAIETLHIEPIGVANPFLSLWLVGEPPIASF